MWRHSCIVTHVSVHRKKPESISCRTLWGRWFFTSPFHVCTNDKILDFAYEHPGGPYKPSLKLWNWLNDDDKSFLFFANNKNVFHESQTRSWWINIGIWNRKMTKLSPSDVWWRVSVKSGDYSIYSCATSFSQSRAPFIYETLRTRSLGQFDIIYLITLSLLSLGLWIERSLLISWAKNIFQRFLQNRWVLKTEIKK